ncbi:MAG TPA: hypothetical protein VN638_03730 [Nitrospiraceae bacterium]|nr:hypothetical protein [Nitrospiraceae bacterium]
MKHPRLGLARRILGLFTGGDIARRAQPLDYLSVLIDWNRT